MMRGVRFAGGFGAKRDVTKEESSDSGNCTTEDHSRLGMGAHERSIGYWTNVSHPKFSAKRGCLPPAHLMGQFTTFIGVPFRNASTLRMAVSRRRARAERVAHARWGVMKQFLARKSGLSDNGGSTERTSRA